MEGKKKRRITYWMSIGSRAELLGCCREKEGGRERGREREREGGRERLAHYGGFKGYQLVSLLYLHDKLRR